MGTEIVRTMSVNATTGVDIVLQLITVTINLAVIILCIYGLVLSIRLIKRGIKALDIYIEKNTDEKV